MLQRFLLITLTLCSLSATAQWQQTGSKVRYVNGLGIPTKDTAAGVAADSSQIVIRPADSSLYIKYKRTWVKVGSGISGSGTTNRVIKFTGATTIGNSQITDNGTSVGINQTSPIYQLHVTSGGSAVVFTDAGTAAVIAGTNPSATISKRLSLRGDTLTMTGGGINGSDHLLISGTGNIGIGYTAPAAKLSVDGTTLINTNTDNGVDKLQVSGSMNVSARATAVNISATNNLSVTNDVYQGSGTADANYTILANGTSSGWGGRFVGAYGTGAFFFQHRNNSASWTTCFTLNAASGVGATTFSDNIFVGGQGYLTVNSGANNGVDKLLVNGSAIATQYKLSALNTAPATASSTGTLGEIRIDANYIYICTATNTWKRVAIATW